MQGLCRRPATLGAPREPEDHLYANDSMLSCPPHQSSYSYTLSMTPMTDLSLTQTMLVPGMRFNKRHLQSGMFNRLPDGIVLKIFSYLETTELIVVSQVCKRFETLCWNTPECWRIIQLKGEVRGDKLLKTIFKRLLGQMIEPSLPFIERVHVSHGCKLTDKSLGVISRRCPELTHLQVQSSNDIYDTGITEILNKCTNLQHLDLTGWWLLRLNYWFIVTKISHPFRLPSSGQSLCWERDHAETVPLAVSRPDRLHFHRRL